MKASFPDLSIPQICGLFGRSKQAFYQGERRSQDRFLEEEVILQEVLSIRKELPKLGVRKLHFLLQLPLARHGIQCGRDRLFDLLRSHSLLIKKRKRRPRTTDSEHGRPVFSNFAEGFIPDQPHQIWFCDITYVVTSEGFGYLSLITDGYSHKVVGYGFRQDLSAQGCLQALTMAQQQWPAKEKLIHHSDQGSQYVSKTYIEQLQGKKQPDEKLVVISMSRKRSPQDNPIGERINGILKDEFELNSPVETFEEVLRKVDKAVVRYNTLRPHSSCDFLTPEQAHKRTGLLNRRW